MSRRGDANKIDEYNGIVATIYSQYCYESWIDGQAATEFYNHQLTLQNLLIECELNLNLIDDWKMTLPRLRQRSDDSAGRPRRGRGGEEKRGESAPDYARRREQQRRMVKAKRAAQLKGNRLRRSRMIASQPFSVISRNKWSKFRNDPELARYFTGGKKKTRKKRRRRRKKTRGRRKKHKKRKTRRKR